jgi:hypothetical protein
MEQKCCEKCWGEAIPMFQYQGCQNPSCPCHTPVSGWEEDLEDLLSNDWQRMEGGDLLDVDPIKWVRKLLTQARAERDAEILAEVEKLKSAIDLKTKKGGVRTVVLKDVKKILTHPNQE